MGYPTELVVLVAGRFLAKERVGKGILLTVPILRPS